MGIKGLNKLINQYAINAISQKNISDFAGSKIAIDSEILIHKYKSIESKNSHIFGFINNIQWYLENGIIPIYVFDGSPNYAKQTNIISRRINYKENILCKIKELENKFIEQIDNIDIVQQEGVHSIELDQEINETLDQLFRIQRKISYMNVGKNHRNECKYLLKLLGIPFIVADDDAEAFCVTLHKKGIADYVYTEDTDIIPYFIASLEDNDNKPIKILRKGSNISTVIVLDILEIYKSMNLGQKSFIDMCILSGCDYCTTINKMNPYKAYHYMLKYKSIENLIENIEIPEDFKYQVARDIFFINHDKVIEKPLNIGQINIENLKIYLQVERGIIPGPIIDKYQKIYNIFLTKNKKNDNN